MIIIFLMTSSESAEASKNRIVKSVDMERNM